MNPEAQEYYNKYVLDKTKISCIPLPSTSPANAAYSVERLLEYWKNVIL